MDLILKPGEKETMKVQISRPDAEGKEVKEWVLLKELLRYFLKSTSQR